MRPVRRLARAFVAIVAAPMTAALLVAGCSFPEVGFGETSSTSTSGAGGGTGGEAGAAATSASSSRSSGGGGGGEAASSSASSGGSLACDIDMDGEVSVACESGTDCDDDGDQYLSTACDSGTDCDDTNALVHPEQPGTYHERAAPEVGFDYDCSGAEEPETEFTSCEGLCSPMTNVFLEDVACGQVGSYGDCSSLCRPENLTTRVRRCH